MSDPFPDLPLLRHLPAAFRGAVLCVAVVAGTASVFAFWFLEWRPSTGEADSLAQLGAAFLIAYGVEMSWVVRESNQRRGPYEVWLGFVTGLAVCGLSGVFVAVGLADTGHGSSALREIGFAWCSGSIVLLGVMVASTPLLTYEWRHQLATDLDDE